MANVITRGRPTVSDRSFCSELVNPAGKGVAAAQVQYLKEIIPKISGTKKMAEPGFFLARMQYLKEIIPKISGTKRWQNRAFS